MGAIIFIGSYLYLQVANADRTEAETETGTWTEEREVLSAVAAAKVVRDFFIF